MGGSVFMLLISSGIAFGGYFFWHHAVLSLVAGSEYMGVSGRAECRGESYGG
jgi:hypothetical protein